MPGTWTGGNTTSLPPSTFFCLAGAVPPPLVPDLAPPNRRMPKGGKKKRDEPPKEKKVRGVPDERAVRARARCRTGELAERRVAPPLVPVGLHILAPFGSPAAGSGCAAQLPGSDPPPPLRPSDSSRVGPRSRQRRPQRSKHGRRMPTTRRSKSPPKSARRSPSWTRWLANFWNVPPLRSAPRRDLFPHLHLLRCQL